MSALSLSNIEARLELTMARLPTLSDFGIGIYWEYKDRSIQKQKAILAKDREILRNSAARVLNTVEWLFRNVKFTRTLNRKGTSYGFKHTAEWELGYITNGVFIAAGIIAGYRYRIEQNSPNVLFGMSDVSLLNVRKRYDHSYKIAAAARVSRDAYEAAARVSLAAYEAAARDAALAAERVSLAAYEAAERAAALAAARVSRAAYEAAARDLAAARVSLAAYEAAARDARAARDAARDAALAAERVSLAAYEAAERAAALAAARVSRAAYRVSRASYRVSRAAERVSRAAAYAAAIAAPEVGS